MTELCSNRRWYVVQTQPHAETKAAYHLCRQGFEIYLPRFRKRRRHARKVEDVVAPLFPRYLFVAIDLASQRWRAVRSTIGVSQLVCCGEDPTPVRDEIVADLRTREDAAGVIRLNPAFTQGEKVRVIGGAFSESLGLFEEMTDHERVAVLVELLGRKVRVVMDVVAVEAA